MVAIMTEPVSWQTVTMAGLAGVEAVLLAGIVVRGTSQAQSLGLDKAATNRLGKLSVFVEFSASQGRKNTLSQC